VADLGSSLTRALDYVWGRFLDRLEGLGNGEYFWEPAGLVTYAAGPPGCRPPRSALEGLWGQAGGGLASSAWAVV
jgi:hypothetical protein